MVVLFFAVILTILSFLFKESKAMAIMMFTFMWILYGWNSSNGDYEVYEKVYNDSLFSLLTENYEIGFKLLCTIGNLIGFSFQEFLIVISGVILILWLRFIVKYAIYPALVSVLFFWVFFPLDYVLLRNFLAFSIVLQGIGCIIDDVKYKYVKYTIFVLIAFTIHLSSIFYLIFLLLALNEGRRMNFRNIIICVVVGLIFYRFLGQEILAGLLSSSGSRDEFYQSNLITFLSLFIYQLIGTLFIAYLFSEMRSGIINSRRPNMYLILLNINIIIFFVTILYYDYSIFVRLYRNIAIINCIFITNGFLFVNKNNIIEKTKIAFLFICYLIFFFNYFITPFMNDTLFSLFENNILLSQIKPIR